MTMSFAGVLIRSLRNGGTQIDGYRDDLAASDVITLSLTSIVGVSSYLWRLLARPELSTAGGAGPEPIILGTSKTATFTVDVDGTMPMDGAYVADCLVNYGTPTQTSIQGLLVRKNTATTSDGRSLRMLGYGEREHDTALAASIRAGYGTDWSRWTRKIVDTFSAGSSLGGGPNGVHITTRAVDGVFTGAQPDQYYLPGEWKGSYTGGITNPATGTIWAVPLYLPMGGTIDKLKQKLHSGSGLGSALLRCGIYTNSATGVYPSARLLDYEMSFVSSDTMKAFTLPTPLALPPALYWAVATANMGTITGAFKGPRCAGMWPILGHGKSTMLNADLVAGVAWSHAFTYGALPATFPSSSPSVVLYNTQDAILSFLYRLIA